LGAPLACREGEHTTYGPKERTFEKLDLEAGIRKEKQKNKSVLVIQKPAEKRGREKKGQRDVKERKQGKGGRLEENVQ